MKLLTLYLQAFGPFTNRALDLGSTGQTLVLVYGPNEAGKSAMLRAISDLRFGIPPQSKDNFVHAHPDMRVGGVFLDHHGHEHALLRRKGRGNTLHFATINGGLSATETPVPSELEALLTGGLSKDEYETMFALDHQRLREGGEALLKGEGEVGAALFEASAGVRSIPTILDRLDQSARRFFMPGARGKNARINEALKAFDEQHDTYKRGLVRPGQWSELFKGHEAAVTTLETLEDKRLRRQSQLLLIKELRAVEPLLRTFDQAVKALTALADVTLLSTNAATERVAAETGLAVARHNANIAASEVGRQRSKLQELVLDAAALAVAPAIERLGASAESVDVHRKELADACVEVQGLQASVTGLASQIDPTAQVFELLKRVPSPTGKAAIDERLRSAERTDQALVQHRVALARLTTDTADAEAPHLPSSESRTMLRSAQLEVTRSDAILQRLVALSAEIKAAQRNLSASLEAIGLADEATVLEVRPLLDAEIDAAKSQVDRNTTRRDALEFRIGEIGAALAIETVQHDQLLAGGAVPTADDVQSSRAHRDLGWDLVRGTYIDLTLPSIDAYSGSRPLPQVYEEAIQKADLLADELARDTAHAAQLQNSLRAIKRLEDDREELTRQLAHLVAEANDHAQGWDRRLNEQHLRVMTPGELREWQGLLTTARQAIEAMQRKRDEEETARAIELSLAATLRLALTSTEMARPGEDVPLRTLLAMAIEIEDEIKQREKDLNTSAGKRQEREQLRQQMLGREQELEQEFRTAKEALEPVFAEFLLSRDAIVPMARARLDEFDTLVAAQEKQNAAAIKVVRSREALATLERQAGAIVEALGDPPPPDLRLYIDQLTARLTRAKENQNARAFAEQALENALSTQHDQEETAAKHAGALTALCGAVGVTSATMLPDAEDRSRRKREAQAEVDRSRAQMAQASRHSIEALRTLLEGQDAAHMDADEENCTAELTTLEEQLRAARGREEETRRALEAIDSADTAAAARESMEQAAAGVRGNMGPWMRSRLAHRLLAEALQCFRDRAQGPMLKAASAHFEHMTAGEFVRLVSDDSDAHPILLALRTDGSRIGVEAMSEGTRDQLYLALRLAALGMRRDAGIDLPVILDDVLVTSDDERTGLVLEALAGFSKGSQVLVFTHHEHLLDVARSKVAEAVLRTVSL